MNRTYTNSPARIAANNKKANWEKRLEILTLRNQGWTFERIAELFRSRGDRASRVSVFQAHSRVKNMTIAQLEAMARKVNL